MEEIRLWKVSGSNDSPTITDISSVAQTQTEEMLEEALVKSPTLLADGLRLVGRQTETRRPTRFIGSRRGRAVGHF
jgi:hypothetical protein